MPTYIMWVSLQRALVDAFSPSPSLAAELVRKALQLQQMQVGLTVHQLFSSLYLTLLLLLATFQAQPNPGASVLISVIHI